MERKGGEESGGDVPAGGLEWRDSGWDGVRCDSPPCLLGRWREGAVSQGTRAAASVLEKARKQTCPWTPRIKAALQAPWFLAPWYPHQTSNLHHEMINGSYFRPRRVTCSCGGRAESAQERLGHAGRSLKGVCWERKRRRGRGMRGSGRVLVLWSGWDFVTLNFHIIYVIFVVIFMLLRNTLQLLSHKNL